MIKKIMFCVLAIAALTAQSQVVATWGFINYYSDDPLITSVSTGLDANSRVYTAGRVLNTTSDIVIHCTDSTGAIVWTYTYDGGGYDSPRKIRVDASGKTYVTGVRYNGSNLDWITIVLSPSGSLIFSKIFDNGVSDDDEAADLRVDSSGDVYVTGKGKNGLGEWKAITVKYQAGTGNVLWTHVLPSTGYDAEGVCLTLANNQAHVIVGGNENTASNGSDAIAYRLTTFGGSLGWQINIDGTANSNDSCSAILLSGANIVLSGMVNNTTTGEDYFIAKLDGMSGSSVFQRDYDFSATDRATAIVKDDSAHIAVTGLVLNPGTSLYEYHTNLYDSLGTLKWTNKKRIYTASANVDPQLAVDTIAWHFYVSGEIERATADILVYQVTPGGNIGWEKNFDRPLHNGKDVATCLAVNGIGVVFVSAMTTNTGSGDFDITTMKIVQTPVYFPIDVNNANEPPAPNALFYKNTGEILFSNATSATEVEYYTKFTSPQFFFRKNSLSFVTRRVDTLGTDSTDRIDMNFLEGSPLDEIYAFETQDTGFINYYKPHCGGATGITGVKGSRRLMVPEIYPGIDLHYYSNTDGLKMYYVVKPSYNPGSILMQFDGNISTSLNGSNELRILSSLSDIQFKAPVFYNVGATLSGTVVTITTTTMSGVISNVSGDVYAFAPGTYNPALPLVIEIEQKGAGAGSGGECTNWSTYFGGTGFENGSKVITNPISGAGYLAGQSSSPNFPSITSQVPTTHTGYDALHVRLLTWGQIMYYVYFGGTAFQKTSVSSICEGANGDLYMTGTTDDATLPLLPAANSSLQGSKDAYIARFNTNILGTLLYARYLGGSGEDEGNDLAYDNAGNVYVVGHTKSSSGLPLTNPGTVYYQSASVDYDDGFLGRLTSTNTLDWFTLFGGGGSDNVQSVKVLPNGNIIMSGITASSTRASANVLNPLCDVPLSATYFPDCNSGYSQNYGGGTFDNFITELDGTGVLQWSTYYGGLGNEISAKIVPDLGTSNDFYLVGTTQSRSGALSMGPTGSYIQNYPNPISGPNWERGYLARFVNRQPVWHTLIGEGNAVFVNEGALDVNGNIYLTGKVLTTNYTSSLACVADGTANITGFPECVQPGTHVQTVYGGGSYDAFVIGFANDFTMVWSQFYGGNSYDEGNSLCVEKTNNKLWMTGNTESTAGFPLYNPNNSNYQQNTNNNSTVNNPGLGSSTRDMFIAALCLDQIPVGIRENPKTQFQNNSWIYPNPSTGNFSVMIDKNNERCSYEIYDVTGRVVSSGAKESNEKTLTFNLSGQCANGLYLLKLRLGSNQYTHKVIIE